MIKQSVHWRNEESEKLLRIKIEKTKEERWGTSEEMNNNRLRICSKRKKWVQNRKRGEFHHGCHGILTSMMDTAIQGQITDGEWLKGPKSKDIAWWWHHVSYLTTWWLMHGSSIPLVKPYYSSRCESNWSSYDLMRNDQCLNLHYYVGPIKNSL